MADILNHNQIFDSPQAALAHFGVKGMKWGVRKDDRAGAGEGAALAVAVAIYAGITVAMVRHEYVDSGKKHQKSLDKEARKTGKEHEWKKKDSLTGPKSRDEILKDVTPAINKGFPKER